MSTFLKSGVSVLTRIRLFTLELSNQRGTLKGQMEEELAMTGRLGSVSTCQIATASAGKKSLSLSKHI